MSESLALPTKPAADPNTKKKRALLQIVASLAPLTEETIAELKKIEQERDKHVRIMKETAQKLERLQSELEKEADPEKKRSLEEQIETESIEIKLCAIRSRFEEQRYAVELSCILRDNRLLRLATRNQWPDTRVNLPSPEKIEEMRQKKIKCAQRSLEAIELYNKAM